MSGAVHKRETCRLCDSKKLSLVFELEATPPANCFVSLDDIKQGKSEERFPLELYFCATCFHLQLLHVVEPKILFSHYVYVSGTSPSFVEHFRKYCEAVESRLKTPASQRYVIDIGSNDGTLLKFFKQKGYKILGIDPAENLAAQATAEGIPTLCDFFNEKVAEKVRADYGLADVVVANNVFAHIDDLQSVTQGVRRLLKPDGFFSFEVSYLKNVIEGTLFDTIYHEHLSYHSVRPLQTFFAAQGLELFDVQGVDTHGGSLRGFVQLADGPYQVTSALAEFIEAEQTLGLYEADTFVKFADQISQVKAEINSMLKGFKNKGLKIAAFGAPAKATTLMYHFNLNRDFIEFIVDDNPLKQGLYSPGLHVPVLSSRAISAQRPDCLVILAWNFAEAIISKNKPFLDGGGRFIVPLPEPKIIANQGVN